MLIAFLRLRKPEIIGYNRSNMLRVNKRVKSNNIKVIMVEGKQIPSPLHVSNLVHAITLVQNLVIRDYSISRPKQLTHLQFLLLRCKRIVIDFIAVLSYKIKRCQVCCAEFLCIFETHAKDFKSLLHVVNT